MSWTLDLSQPVDLAHSLNMEAQLACLSSPEFRGGGRWPNAIRAGVNDCLLVNAPTWGPSGLNFSRATPGVNPGDPVKYVQLPNSSLLKKSREFTVFATVARLASDLLWPSWYHTNDTQIGTNGYFIGYFNNTRLFGISRPNNPQICYGSTQLADGVFYRCAVTVGAGTTAAIRVYVDGNIDGQTTTTEGLATQTTLGAQLGGSSIGPYPSLWPGIVQECWVFSRALSPTEIASLTEQSTRGYRTPDSPLRWIKGVTTVFPPVITASNLFQAELIPGLGL